MRFAFAFALTLILCSTLSAQDLKRRLGDNEVDDFWIYDDWEKAKTLAAMEKKPIFVVFRCVP